MKRICDGYIQHAKLIGALYCIVPTLGWFGVMMTQVPWRDVYGLRLALALTVGSFLAARANAYGVSLWLIKHRSTSGPATVADGAIIGGCVGIALTLLPALTSLIGTEHIEQAKWFIIGAWLTAIWNGMLIGALAGKIGIKYVSQEASSSMPAEASA